MALDRTEDELVTALEAIRDRPDSTDAYGALGERRLTLVGDRDPFVSVDDARGFYSSGRSSSPAAGTCPVSSARPSSTSSCGKPVARWT